VIFPKAVPAVVVSLAAGFAAASCHSSPAEESAGSTTIAVTGQPARVQSLRDALSVPGTIVPSAAADQTVSASEPAEIVEIPKGETTTVQAGDVLVKLEIASITVELRTRQLEVAQATTKVEAARSEVTRLNSLNDRGLVPRNKLDEGKSALAAAEATLGQANTLLETAKSQQDRTIVRARFPGIVTKVWHKPGDVVTGDPNDPILRVVDPTKLQVSVPVPVASVQRIDPAKPVTIQTATGTTETATLAFRQAQAPSATTAEVRLALTPASTLPIDTQVQVEFLFDERPNAIVVPKSAVQTDTRGPFVWVAGDDGQAHRREVQPGLSVGGLTQIVNGLAAGERVILTGVSELAEGTVISWRISG
jgi:multidrug efflux system membrane fusion protein